MEKICNNILGLFYFAAQNSSNGQEKLKKLLDDVYERLCKLTERIKKQRVEIAFVGKSNVGKSTLINAVFGEDVAPKRNGPYTAAVVEYRYAEKYSIILQKPGCLLAEVISCNSAKELYEKLKQESTVSANAVFAEAERIVVKLPSAMLKNGAVIYDTPGFGATKGEEETEGVHDGIVKEFLEKQCCDQIFWIFRGDNPTDTELDFVKEYIKFYDDSNRLIVNVDDDDTPVDLQNEYKKRYLANISALRDHTIFANAKCKDDAQKLQAFLAGYIEDRRGYEKAVAMLLKRFCSSCNVDYLHPVWQATALAKIEHLAEEKKYIAEAIAELKNLADGK